MRISIKNLLFQPLAFHLVASGEGLHLTARECKEILAEQVSEEIQLAAARGLVSLSEESTQLDPLVETAAGEHIANPVDDTRPQARQRKRRER